jgi:hypothetical protein
MDVVNQTPHQAIYVCDNLMCEGYGTMTVSQNWEYLENVLPEKVNR